MGSKITASDWNAYNTKIKNIANNWYIYNVTTSTVSISTTDVAKGSKITGGTTNPKNYKVLTDSLNSLNNYLTNKRNTLVVPSISNFRSVFDIPTSTVSTTPPTTLIKKSYTPAHIESMSFSVSDCESSGVYYGSYNSTYDGAEYDSFHDSDHDGSYKSSNYDMNHDEAPSHNSGYVPSPNNPYYAHDSEYYE